MEANAIGRYQRVSPRKIGRILHLIRDKNVPEALSTLKFLNKPTKESVMKTLQSAVANAVAKAGKAKLEEKDLFVSEARVNGGPMMKRWQAGARGSPMMYRRRTSHIYIAVKQKTTDAAGTVSSGGTEKKRS
jgi:large subunit ribosomal protein L22